MGRTEKGIYYQDDYNEQADVLKDMKLMAESTDKVIGENIYDDTALKQQIESVNIEQIEQNTELKTLKEECKRLKEENTDLKNTLPSGQVSGENLALEDSADMRLKKIEISGNTWQETRSGKNIFSNKEVLTNTTYDKDTDIYTFNVAEKYDHLAYKNTVLKKIKANTDYKIVIEVLENTLSDILSFNTNNTIFQGSEIKNIQVTQTGTLVFNAHTRADLENAMYDIWFSHANTITGTFKCKIMVTESTDTNYEEYGAMPSNEFPSENRSCGDNINLLNIYDIHSAGHSVTTNGVDITFLEDGAIKVNGTSTKAFSIPIIGTYQSENYKLNLDGNYLLSGLTNGCSIIFYNKTNKIAEFANGEVKEIKQKVDYAIFSIKLNANFDNTIIRPKLEPGTVATPYSKYAEGNINFIICNKNVANTDILASKNLQAVTIINKNAFTIDLSQGSVSALNSVDLLFGKLDGNKQYVLNYHQKQENLDFRPYLTFVYEDGTKYGEANYEHEKDIVSISTKGKKIVSIVLAWNTQTKGGTAEFSNIMLKEIEDGENYVEHKEQNFTFPLKQKFYKDSYLAENEIHHKRSEIKLDGTTDKLKVSGVEKYTNDIYYCTVHLPSTAINGSRVYCSHFKNNGAKVEIGNCYITGGGNILVIVLEDQTITTVEQANNWLTQQKEAGTAVTVNYLLATEELEEYSAEQKAIYNEIMQAKSYKEKTHIFSADEISPKFDVEYVKDLGILLSKLEVGQ